jgi:two-component system copper resistance phosphate regulon response regulator CusR
MTTGMTTGSPGSKPSEQTLRVLVVDDDPKFRSYVGRGLGENRIGCDAVETGEQALELLTQAPPGSYDLVLLDVMLPGLSGWETLERMRADGHDLPVIFLTARHSVNERVRGFDLGADDYVVKPFAFVELLARVRAVVRRHLDLPQVEAFGLGLDLATRSVTVKGRRIELSPREFELLHVLASARGEPLSRQELLRRVWSMDFDPGTNVVPVLVRRLRGKLGAHRIETVPKLGYRLAPDGQRGDERGRAR